MQDKISQLILINTQLTEENQRLKTQIKTHQEKERMFKLTIDSIKRTLKDNQKEYLREYNNFKEREAKNKELFAQYQKTITNEVASSMSNEYDKESTLLRNRVDELMDLIHNNGLAYELKINEYKNIIATKDNQLGELKQSIAKILKETKEEAMNLRNNILRLEEKISSSSGNNNESYSDYLTPPKQLTTDNNICVSRNINNKDSQPRIGKLQKPKGNLVLNHHKKIMEDNERLKQLNKTHIRKDNYSYDMRIRNMINPDDSKCKTNTSSPSNLMLKKMDMYYKHNKTLTPSYSHYPNYEAYEQ